VTQEFKGGERLRILLVDDHAVVRLGLRSLFETVERFFVVGEAASVSEAVAAAQRWQPDVVVLDVRLPDGSGVEACRTIRAEREATQVVMLTSYGDEDALVESVLAGASGYLLKGAGPDELIRAVERAGEGESLLDGSSTRAVLDVLQRQLKGDSVDPLSGLSDQEKKILPLIAQGKTNREIGSDLYLSDQTVKGYVSSILKKLRLSRRAEAAAFIARQMPHAGVVRTIGAAA
jgi:DNA-binding NarL/FixJ family response regulator